jgi:magnesium transporter
VKLNPSNTLIIKRLLVGRGSRPLRAILDKIDPTDVANLLPELNSAETHILIEALNDLEKAPSVLLHLDEHQRLIVFSRLDDPEILKIFKICSDEIAAKLLSSFDSDEQLRRLELIDETRRVRIQRFLNYPEDSAGRIMQTNLFYLKSNLSALEALDQLRSRAQQESIYYVYCVDSNDKLEGVVSLRQLVTCNPQTQLANLMRRDLIFVHAQQPAKFAAQFVSKYALIAIPVVDESMKLLGIITVDDIVDQIQEQATAEVYAQAGLQEDDRVYTSPFKSVQKRLPWMLVNLGLAAVASSVVSLFEDTMSTLIILASLKNIVAGVAGNTAIQSLTVVNRGIAVDDFKFVTYTQALLKEFISGLAIGVITGLGAGLLTYIWKGDLFVSAVIIVSMIINSIVAAAFGSAVPLILVKFKLDPATGSGPIVTMVTDIFSFFSFLGIASLALKFFGHS